MRTRCPTAPPSDRARPVSWARRLVAVVTLGVLSAAGLASPVGAADPTTTTVPTSPQVPIPRIIPAPNSGHAPRDADDPGGWGQYAVFLGIVAGVSLIGVLVWLDARRSRRRQADRDSTRSDPVDDT